MKPAGVTGVVDILGATVTTKAYMWGWFAYLLGSVGVLFVFWYITRPLTRWLKLPLRALAAALLLTPWSVSPQLSQWAPAWVVSLFDGFAQQGMSLWRAGGPLLAMLAVALLVAFAELWRQKRKGSRQPIYRHKQPHLGDGYPRYEDEEQDDYPVGR